MGFVPHGQAVQESDYAWVGIIEQWVGDSGAPVWAKLDGIHIPLGLMIGDVFVEAVETTGRLYEYRFTFIVCIFNHT